MDRSSKKKRRLDRKKKVSEGVPCRALKKIQEIQEKIDTDRRLYRRMRSFEHLKELGVTQEEIDRYLKD